jgi:hypothetical protein
MGFVEVPPDAIRSTLSRAGFTLLPDRAGEEVWTRAHDRDARFTVQVYTSIDSAGTRGRGQDAIRVVALLTTPTKTYPLYKGRRVHRTGSPEKVCARMLERAREAYGEINRRLREGGGR